MMVDDETKKLLSIIVPAYNAEKTIVRCLNSLLNQVLKNIEIIVVDDCSSDETQAIVATYLSRYPAEIIYIRSDVNEGVGGARNKGILKAKGKYMAFVDSDDWVDSGLYQVALSKMEANSAEIAIFGVKNEYGNVKSSEVRYTYPYHNVIDNSYALSLLCRAESNDIYMSPMVCQKVFRSDFIMDHDLKFELDSLYEDDGFTFRSLLFSCNIIIIPGVFYHYYQNPNSLTHSFSKKHIQDLIRTFCDLRNELSRKQLFDRYKNEFFSFFEKCINSVMERLFICEADSRVQKEYIVFMLEKLQENFPISTWVDYIDIHRIHRMFI